MTAVNLPNGGCELCAVLEEDLAAVALLEKDCFADAWNEKLLRAELENKLAHYLVCRSANRLAAYGGFWLVAGEAQITRLAVAQDLRRRGLGLYLSKGLLKLARQLGATAVTLEVRSGNLAAQKLYQRCGFQTEGVRPHYYSDNHEDALIMWLYL